MGPSTLQETRGVLRNKEQIDGFEIPGRSVICPLCRPCAPDSAGNMGSVDFNLVPRIKNRLQSHRGETVACPPVGSRSAVFLLCEHFSVPLLVDPQILLALWVSGVFKDW